MGRWTAHWLIIIIDLVTNIVMIVSQYVAFSQKSNKIGRDSACTAHRILAGSSVVGGVQYFVKLKSNEASTNRNSRTMIDQYWSLP